MRYANAIAALQAEIVATTQKLIQFNTEETVALANAPFGVGNRAALDYVLAIGRQWGFATKDLDGYAGYWEFGRGADVVVILPHLGRAFPAIRIWRIKKMSILPLPACSKQPPYMQRLFINWQKQALSIRRNP
jgi:hypothetical protein